MDDLYEIAKKHENVNTVCVTLIVEDAVDKYGTEHDEVNIGQGLSRYLTSGATRNSLFITTTRNLSFWHRCLRALSRNETVSASMTGEENSIGRTVSVTVCHSLVKATSFPEGSRIRSPSLCFRIRARVRPDLSR